MKADYAPKALNFWVAQANTWALGGEPADLPRIAKARAKPASRDVFAYFIYEAKLRAPARRGYIRHHLNLIVAAIAIGTQQFPITNLKSI